MVEGVSKQQIASYFMGVIALASAASLGVTLHFGDAGMACLGSTTALLGASVVLGLFLRYNGRKSDLPHSIDWERVISQEKWRKAILISSFILSLGLGACLGLNLMEHQSSIGCIATCSALTAASFVLAAVLYAKGKERFRYRTEKTFRSPSIAQTFNRQLLNQHYFDKGIRVTGEVEAPSQQGSFPKSALILIELDLKKLDLIDQGTFGEVVKKYVPQIPGQALRQMWDRFDNSYPRQVERCIQQSPLFQEVLQAENPFGITDMAAAKACDFHDGFIEIVDTVGIEIPNGTDLRAVRRRGLDTTSGHLVTEYMVIDPREIPKPLSHYFSRK